MSLFAGILGIEPAQVVSIVLFLVVLVMVVAVLVGLEEPPEVLMLMGALVEVVALLVLVAVALDEVPAAEVMVSGAVAFLPGA